MVLPAVNRFLTDNNLFAKLLGNVPSVSETQFNADTPNELEHYYGYYYVALEQLSNEQFASLSREIEKDQAFMHQIMQNPDPINGVAPTRAQIEADRNVTYLNEVQTLSPTLL